MVECGTCETSNKKLYGGDIDPGLGAGDGGFEVFGEATVTIEPREGAADHLTAWQDFEADGIGHALDELDAPLAEFAEGRQ
jgi:hypothetical protein